MKITELYGVIRLNIQSYESGINRAVSLTQGFRRDFAQAAADIDRAASRIGTVVGGMALGVTAVTTKMGFSFLQSRDSAEIMLATILKDGPLAKKTLTELFEAAKRTPFSFEGLKDGMVMFANANMAAEKLIPNLYKVSDAVAAIGGTDADIKGVTMALSQMMTAGRLNAQDMMQLTNRGIAGWDILAEKMGASVAEVRKASESGAIDGRLAADMIIQGMGERFAGAGDKLSQKFQGLWSSFLDQARANAGRIVEPLYDAIGRVFGRINQAVDAGGANGWIERLRNMVAGFAQNLEQLATGSGPQALEMIVRGFEQLGSVGTSVMSYLNQQGPALAQAAQGWFDLLKPILEFLAVHPELVVALMFFKGGQLLGINQSVVSLGTAFLSGGSAMAQMVSQVGGLNSALFALKAGGIAAAIAAIVVLAKLIYDANVNIRKLREETEKSRGLDSDVAAKQGDRRNKIIETGRLAEDDTPGRGKAFLQSELEIAKREMAATQNSVAGARKNHAASAEEQTLLDFVGGGDLVTLGFEEELKSAEENAKRAKEFVIQLEQEIQRMTGRGQAAPAPGAAGAQPPSGSGSLADMLAAKQAEKDAKKLTKDEERAAKRAEAKEEKEAAKRLEETGDMLADFGVKLHELKGQLSPAQLEMASGWLRQIALDYQEGEYNSKEYKNALDEVNLALRTATSIADARENFEQNSGKAADNLRDSGASDATMQLFGQQVDSYRAYLDKLATDFDEDKISAHQFSEGLQLVDEAMREAAQVAQQVTSAQTGISKQIIDEQMQMQQQVSKGLLSQGTLNYFNKLAAGIQSQMDTLAKKFQAGDINAQEFALGVEKLRNAMQQATAAALEQEKAEKRAWMTRLMTNQGTAADYQRLYMQQYQAQMQQYDQGLQSMFDQMFGLGQAAQNLQTGFTNINNGIQQFGQNLNQISSGIGGNAPGIAQAWTGISNMINSQQGQADLLYNNIQLLTQSLQLITDPVRRANVQAQIAQMQGQLANMGSAAPLFTNTRDAAGNLGGESRQRGNSIRYELNFPNWSPTDAHSIRVLAEAVAAELDRRGRRN